MSPEVLRADRTLLGLLISLIAVAMLTAFAPAAEPDGSAGPSLDARPIHLEGVASWYGDFFAGRTTACGQTYDPDGISAAHRSLPCGTRLRVEHQGRSVEVTITDRGPYVQGRFLDLSRGAFRRLAPLEEGIIDVRATLLPTPSG